jgi:hypothetical protein
MDGEGEGAGHRIHAHDRAGGDELRVHGPNRDDIHVYSV